MVNIKALLDKLSMSVLLSGVAQSSQTKPSRYNTFESKLGTLGGASFTIPALSNEWVNYDCLEGLEAPDDGL